MVTILFWNLYRKPIHERVARIVKHFDVDLVILAECSIASEILLDVLNGLEVGPFDCPVSFNGKIRLFSRLTDRTVDEQYVDPIGRVTVRQISGGAGSEFLLVACHLPSKPRSSNSLAGYAGEVARGINETEDRLGHRRTILIGDLNMNPYEGGIVTAEALNAVMTKDRASREERVVSTRPYRFFYNPMWGLFGDRTAGPAGTYHYHSGDSADHYWHIYDQVLVRPGLIDALKEIFILDSDGQESLLTENGFPDRSKASDHLPILCRFDI